MVSLIYVEYVFIYVEHVFIYVEHVFIYVEHVFAPLLRFYTSCRVHFYTSGTYLHACQVFIRRTRIYTSVAGLEYLYKSTRPTYYTCTAY